MVPVPSFRLFCTAALRERERERERKEEEDAVAIEHFSIKTTLLTLQMAVVANPVFYMCILGWLTTISDFSNVIRMSKRKGRKEKEEKNK